MSTLAFIPVKDAGTWLPPFVQQLERLEDIGQVIFSYGESRNQFDTTLDILRAYRDKSRHKVKIKADPDMGEVMSSAQIGKIYSDLQRLMEENPDEYPETHIALLDVDVMRIPPNLLVKLREHDKDIIAPYVWTLWHDSPCRMFYDSMVFRYKGYRFHPYRPPLNNGELLQLDSVGTTFLVRKEVFLDVPYSDPYPHMKFCNDAREKGYTVWADPALAIYHVDLVRFGMFHHELAVLKAIQAGDPDPYRHSDVTPFIKDDGSIVGRGELGVEYTNIYTTGVVP